MELEQQLRVALQFSEPGPAPLEAVMARLSAAPGPAPRGKRRGARRIVIIGVVALAAAAAMLVLKPGSEAPPPTAVVPATIPAASPAAASEPVRVPAAATPAPEPMPVAPQPEAAAIAAPSGLPLFPPRPLAISAAMQDLALQKTVERHPELVEGPDTDSIFSVVLAMRRNGSVITSAARLVQHSELNTVANEMRRLLPTTLGPGGAGISGGSWARHTLLPDGRALRAQVYYDLTVVADDYDASRVSRDASRRKLEQLIRDRYADLLRPSTAPEVNRLTVLLTEDGQIERDKVEVVRAADPRAAAPMPEMPRTAAETGKLVEMVVAATAERMASQLGIAVDRIGVIGNLRVQEGINGLTEDANGNLRSLDQSRSLVVFYVWPRRAGESGPSLEGLDTLARGAQGLQQELEQTQKRLAPAVTIVERLMPEAFTLPNADAGTPLVVLTAMGEAIGAIRLNTRGNEQPGRGAIAKALQQLRPGFPWTRSETETLRNEAGATAQVMFVWLAEEPGPAMSGK